MSRSYISSPLCACAWRRPIAGQLYFTLLVKQKLQNVTFEVLAAVKKMFWTETLYGLIDRYSTNNSMETLSPSSGRN
jgi:hypothetical protein